MSATRPELRNNILPRTAASTASGQRMTKIRASTRLPESNYPTKEPRFEKRGQLGSGGFGVVDEAVDIDTAKLVAVKVIRLKQGQQKQAFKHWYSVKEEISILQSL